MMNNKYLLLLTIFCAPLYAVRPLKVKALFEACEKGDYKRTSNLLAQRGLSTVRNEKGQTLLHVAKNPEILQLLLSYGIPTHIADNNGHTPLMTHLHTPNPNNRPLTKIVLSLMAYDKNHPSTPIAHRKILKWLKTMEGEIAYDDGYNSIDYASSMMLKFVKTGECPDYPMWFHDPKNWIPIEQYAQQIKAQRAQELERENTPPQSDYEDVISNSSSDNDDLPYNPLNPFGCEL